MSQRASSLVTLPLFLAACAGGVGGADDPVPEVDYCSDAQALAACEADKAFAGSYPAVDAIASGLLGGPQALGCGYAVTLDGGMLYAGGVGVTDTGAVDPTCGYGQCPWGLDDLAPVASVSKTITALAIMRLVEQGRLPEDLSSVTVADLLPGAPATLADLTVHQLLGHISGLGVTLYNADYLDPEAVAAWVPELETPGLHPRAMWFGMKDTTTPFTLPGIANYSSAAYRILGAIVDARTLVHPSDFLDEEFGAWIEGTETMSREELTSAQLGGYEWYVRQMLADPFLPDGSRHYATCQNQRDRRFALDQYVDGFVWNAGAGQFAPRLQLPGDQAAGAHGPAGGWLMTVGDLARLANGIVEREYVSDASLDRMTEYVATDRGWDFGSGVALLPTTFTADSSGATYKGYGHGGDYTFLGHHAMWRVVELPGGRSIGGAMICTGGAPAPNNAFDSGDLRAALGSMIDQVYTDFVAARAGSPNPITYDPSRANCGGLPDTAESELETEFGFELAETWKALLLSVDRNARVAESKARGLIAAEPEGDDILAAWDAGHLERAASLGLEMMWRRRGERAATAAAAGTGTAPSTPSRRP